MRALYKFGPNEQTDEDQHLLGSCRSQKYSSLQLHIQEKDAVFIGSDCINFDFDALSAQLGLSECPPSAL